LNVNQGQANRLPMKKQQESSMQSRSLAKVLAVLALGVGALGATTAARASGHVSLSIGIPLGAPVYVQQAPQPVYVQPAPQTIYTQPQVIYAPPPVVYAPAPVVYPRASFVIGGPVYRSGWHGGHGGHRGHGGHGHGHR
jgi:hypothetical protein